MDKLDLEAIEEANRLPGPALKAKAASAERSAFAILGLISLAFSLFSYNIGHATGVIDGALDAEERLARSTAVADRAIDNWQRYKADAEKAQAEFVDCDQRRNDLMVEPACFRSPAGRRAMDRTTADIERLKRKVAKLRAHLGGQGSLEGEGDGGVIHQGTVFPPQNTFTIDPAPRYPF